MYIYIDESGTFQRAPARDASISCVGALIVPSRSHAEMDVGFKKISVTWPKEGGEVKGRLLNEDHVSVLCDFLEPLGAIYEVSAMDMNATSDSETAKHQRKQAELITINLTDDHHPRLKEELWKLRRALEEMPPQLYAQFTTLTHALWRTLEHGTLYFCQRVPNELGEFRWVIDAKDKGGTTNSEQWWQSCVKPFLQSHSIRRPMAMLKGGNYSVFYQSFPPMPTPEYLKHLIRDAETNDLKAVLDRHMHFAQSHEHSGLQIVDVLTNAVRRALSGRLQSTGWLPITKLMIRKSGGSVNFIGLGHGRTSLSGSCYQVARKLTRGRRSMIPDTPLSKKPRLFRS